MARRGVRGPVHASECGTRPAGLPAHPATPRSQCDHITRIIIERLPLPRPKRDRSQSTRSREGAKGVLIIIIMCFPVSAATTRGTAGGRETHNNGAARHGASEPFGWELPPNIPDNWGFRHIPKETLDAMDDWMRKDLKRIGRQPRAILRSLTSLFHGRRPRRRTCQILRILRP